jgi:hypothetical protein
MLKKAILVILVLGILALTTISPVLAAKNEPRDLRKVIFIHRDVRSSVLDLPVSEKGFFKLINGGVKWKSLPVSIEVNPTNTYGLSENDVIVVVNTSAEEWDDGAYSGWGGVSVNLFHDTITVTTKTYDDLAWTSDKLDGSNTIVWGDYPEEGVIAVTILWYDNRNKEILEFDVVLDTDYTWTISESGISGTMDLQNILTHELGHGAGLNDVYQPPAYQETMYGYADFGEISKRDLHAGDIKGITKLYG